MDNELKAAIERLRRVDAGESAVSIYPDCYLKPPGYVGKWNAWDAKESVKSSITQDRETLADAYLAEHPADDDEPVTKNWCESKISGNGFLIKLLYRDGTDEAIGMTLSNGAVMMPVVKNPTRGDVRQLCRALGVELKEMPE